MISPGYNPKFECQIIEQANKHHCHVPARVWDLAPETVCAVCMLKNHALFVAAAISTSEVSSRCIAPFRKPRLCEVCGIVQLDRDFWNSGERVCGECRQCRSKKPFRKLEQRCP